MKVVVFGAGGILGQHLLLCVPPGVEPVFCRKTGDVFYRGVDLTDRKAAADFLSKELPDVIVHLAGENRVDVVESDPDKYADLNVAVPAELAGWCDVNGAHLVHVSSQAIFSGNNPPYAPNSKRSAVNAYGRQKIEAEDRVRVHRNWTIARPTFILGIRPLPHVGRMNPLEQMLAQQEQRQVDDRFFSPAFARDVARQLWSLALTRLAGAVFHLGVPITVSRYSLAMMVKDLVASLAFVAPASSSDFPGIAPRPMNTTWAYGSWGNVDLEEGLQECITDWTESRNPGSLLERAKEIAMFLRLSETGAADKLGRGFFPAHAEVAADFRRADPRTDDDLLRWYIGTEAYLGELSTYHLDKGFNYSGMCDGIGRMLKIQDKPRVLCLGDGIGDLTLHLHRQGLTPTYHDLAGSRTVEFAMFRYWRQTGELPRCHLTPDWTPPEAHEEYDAVVALDFMEHLVNVEEWVIACYSALIPDGLFFSQNAFGIGDPEHGGSIPMHLSKNNRYVAEWPTLLQSVGFQDAGGNWWRKP